MVEVEINSKFKVVSHQAHIRKSPSPRGEIIGFAYEGYIIVATKKTSDGSWYYFPLYEGWITTSVLTLFSSNPSSNIYELTKDGNLSAQETVTNPITGDITSQGTSAESFLTDNLSGIFGIPYQFTSRVDRRMSGTEFGRKYGEKIVGRMPLLFLTPGKQAFMTEFSNTEKKAAIQELVDIDRGESGSGVLNNLIDRDGRYYTFEFAYKEYYQYVNPMCNIVAKLLGIGDTTVNIGGYATKLKRFDWSRALNSNFKSYFSAKENVIFYVDSINSISESFSNETRESSLVGTVNGLSDTSKEIQFILGATTGSQISALNADNFETTMSSINSVIDGYLGGSSVLKGLAGDVTTVLSGGKLVFPELWTDSDFSRSYNVEIKLRSPDMDKVSIYLNIIVPFIHLLSMTAPHQLNANGYSAPFLIRAFYKGLFNVDMGIITDLSVSKGKEMAWTDDGLPAEMDISLSIKDLYTSMFISNNEDIGSMINNTALMDYLCNMAGINLAKPELTRQIQVYLMLQGSRITQLPNSLFSGLEESITNLLQKLY